MLLQGNLSLAVIPPASFVVLLAVFSLQAKADPASPAKSVAVRSNVTEQEYRITRSPTMAAFYTVGDDDELIREDLSVETIADPDASPSRLVVGMSSKSSAKGNPKKTSARPAQSTRNTAGAADRCEQHRLYYTRDGRCIRPVYRVTHPPHRGNQPAPMPRMQKSVDTSSGRTKNGKPQPSQSVRVKR